MSGDFRSVELDYKYTATSGSIMISGTQALVRLPMMQRQIDRKAGLDTAGYISGYRGSPIGGYDQELWRAAALLQAHQVHFQPGLNEDLAATAIWGTQTLQHVPDPTVDGVFGICEYLTKTVARQFARLLAYKDEYEVGRLHSLSSVKDELRATFSGDVKLKYNLAPPLFSRRDPVTGHLVKREFGAWMGTVFAFLARLKFLRGTRLDVFGYTAERRMERGLIADYESMIRELLPSLSAANLAAAVALAELPAQIRGFGHVKEASVQKTDAARAKLLAAYRAATAPAGVVNAA